jgi:hypothetical protein
LQQVPLKAIVPEDQRVLLFYEVSDCAPEVRKYCVDLFGFGDAVRTREQTCRLPEGWLTTRAERSADAVRSFEAAVASFAAGQGKEVAVTKIIAIPWHERGLVFSEGER